VCSDALSARGIRIAVVGTTGSGKTTLAKALAAQLGLAFIEMDALNWQTGWRDLSRTDREEFVRRVTLAIAPDAWVLDSAYGLVRDPVWRRATHLIWLDYERRVIMYRVICRSLVRAALRTELWAGNRERWSHILRPSHPIRWAWSTWDRRRKDFEERIERQDYAHLVVLRLRRAARGSKAAPPAEECRRRREAARLDRAFGRPAMRARKASIARARELIAAPLPAIDQSMQTWRVTGCTGEKMERTSSAKGRRSRRRPLRAAALWSIS